MLILSISVYFIREIINKINISKYLVISIFLVLIGFKILNISLMMIYILKIEHLIILTYIFIKKLIIMKYTKPTPVIVLF